MNETVEARELLAAECQSETMKLAILRGRCPPQTTISIHQALRAITKAISRPSTCGVNEDKLAKAICVDVCELPDRTSPDDWPEACLVTSDELYDIIKNRVGEALATLQTRGEGRGEMSEVHGNSRRPHPMTDDHARLCERLRAVEGAAPDFIGDKNPTFETCSYRNPEGPEAATLIESLSRTRDEMVEALGRIAGKNDLSGIPGEDVEAAARNALYECELIADEALELGEHIKGGDR